MNYELQTRGCSRRMDNSKQRILTFFKSWTFFIILRLLLNKIHLPKSLSEKQIEIRAFCLLLVNTRYGKLTSVTCLFGLNS